MRLFLLAALCLLINPTFLLSQSDFSCSIDENASPPPKTINCNNYNLDVEEISRLPIRTIKLAFHYVANIDGENFLDKGPNDPFDARNAQDYEALIVSSMNFAL